jgi:hypothetical protein
MYKNSLHEHGRKVDKATVEIRNFFYILTEFGIFEMGTMTVRAFTMFFMWEGLYKSGPIVSENI